MPGILRVFASRGASVLRGHNVAQRANLHAGPPKEKIGTFLHKVFIPSSLENSLYETVQSESAVGFSMLSLVILGPSGWILAHLEDYKKKE